MAEDSASCGAQGGEPQRLNRSGKKMECFLPGSLKSQPTMRREKIAFESAVS